MKYRTGFFALLALSLAGFSSAGEAAEATPKHFFWKVSGEKGVVYLLGTIHVGKADFYPLAPVIEQSFERADTLIEELDLDSLKVSQHLAQLVAREGSYPAGDFVENHISEATRAHLAEYLDKEKELSESYARMKPWLLSLAIATTGMKQMGLDPAKGLDMHLLDEAAQTKKPVGALETADFQIKLFSSFSDDLQDQLLLSSLLDAERAVENMDLTLNAWMTGDTQKMEEVITRALHEYPGLKPVMERLIDQRNDAMTREIGRFLETPKTYFVAVGAGHLVGERGILSQLRARNYKIEQR